MSGAALVVECGNSGLGRRGCSFAMFDHQRAGTAGNGLIENVGENQFLSLLQSLVCPWFFLIAMNGAHVPLSKKPDGSSCSKSC